MREIISSVPGRICLFGDHMDWLRKQVITSTIEKRLYCRARLNGSDKCTARSFFPFTSYDEFRIKKVVIDSGSDLKYIGAVLSVFKQFDELLGIDFDIIPSSEIDIQDGQLPAGKGLSSSAALCVSSAAAYYNLVNRCDKLINDQLSLLCADIAYKAEHDVLGINCGRMDPYACSIGGVLSINCELNNFSIESLKALNGVDMIIGDTGRTKDTKRILSWLKKRKEAGETSIRKGIESVQNVVTTARDVLSQTFIDYNLLGKLMDENHTYLRDYFQVSGDCPISPSSLDELVLASKHAGALGAKLTGSGGGGCMIALSNPRITQNIIKAIIDAGGVPEVVGFSNRGIRFH